MHRRVEPITCIALTYFRNGLRRAARKGESMLRTSEEHALWRSRGCGIQAPRCQLILHSRASALYRRMDDQKKTSRTAGSRPRVVRWFPARSWIDNSRRQLGEWQSSLRWKERQDEGRREEKEAGGTDATGAPTRADGGRRSEGERRGEAAIGVLCRHFNGGSDCKVYCCSTPRRWTA